MVLTILALIVGMVAVHSPVADRAVKDMQLPDHCLLVSARRGRRATLLKGGHGLDRWG